MLVLDGNIPRFPWEPSTTMLTYRLAGTTEASVSNRSRPHHSANPTHQPPAPSTTDVRPHIFARHGEPQRGSTLLTSDSTLRFRAKDEFVTSLASAGFVVDDIREAPDRPGKELVFIARRND